MKSSLISLALLISVSAVSQELSMIKTFGSARYYLSDTIDLSTKQVLEVMQTNQVAHNEFRKAMVVGNAAGLLGFGGGLLVTLPLATALLGGQPEWSLTAIGIVFIGSSISLEIKHKRRAKGAIDLYNRSLSVNSKVKFQLSAAKAELVIKF